MNRISRSILSTFSHNDPPLDPGISTKTSRIQLFYGAWVNMAQFGIGLAFGFASVQIPHLMDSDSEIQITRVDASWIVSAVPLMVPVGCVISGIMMDWAGRRIMLIVCQVPMFVGWILTALADTPNNIIIARAISGVGCGMAMGPSRAYGTEIALPNMRGVIGAFPNLAVSLGITLTAGLDNFFEWHLLCYICCGFSFLTFCSFILLPETPYFLLQTRSESEARANLALFRGRNYNIEREMAQLIDFKQENNLRKLSLMSSFGMLLTKASCKPFTLIMIYNLIAQAAGVSILLFWSIDLLQQANSSFDVQAGNILLGVTRVVVGTLTSLLLYRYGRRPLAMISAIGVTIVCCVLGFSIMSKNTPSLTPQICLMVYVAFASLGYYTIPFLMAFELYPLQVRGMLGGATISTTSLIIFASTKLEPLMLETLGIAHTFLTFSLFSFIGCVYIFFWLPETKDLTLQEIEEYYKDRRPTLSSQRRIESMNQLAEFSSQSTKNFLDRSNRQNTSRSNVRAQLEAQKKLAKLIEHEIEHQLKLSRSDSDLKRKRSTKVKSDAADDSLKRAMVKEDVFDRESIKSSDSKKSRGITFRENNENNIDNESIKSTKSTGSKKSALKLIFENQIELKKRDEQSPKFGDKRDEKKKDEKREEETPKDKDQPSSSKKYAK